MDTSETYIKMCDCPKIQEPHWEKGWQEGDYFWDGRKVCLCGMDYLSVENIYRQGHNRVRFLKREPMTALVYDQYSPTQTINIKEGEYVLTQLNNGIWLPRQDQLQEMVEYPDLGSVLRDLREFWQRPPNHRITSMEQLWLAFVMKEKYSKAWVNGKWI